MPWQNFQDEVMKRFDDLEALMRQILTKEDTMSAELDTLSAAVTDIKGAADSTIALVNGLSDYIRAHADDPAALMQLAADLEAKKDQLAAAVDANPVPPT